tara:strand:- start:125 stop:442 length:318 start_codon:yes stop_codon:yes gene_type:complete
MRDIKEMQKEREKIRAYETYLTQQIRDAKRKESEEWKVLKNKIKCPKCLKVTNQKKEVRELRQKLAKSLRLNGNTYVDIGKELRVSPSRASDIANYDRLVGEKKI